MSLSNNDKEVISRSLIRSEQKLSEQLKDNIKKSSDYFTNKRASRFDKQIDEEWIEFNENDDDDDDDDINESIDKDKNDSK